MKTKVIFRVYRDKNKDVIALFPEILADTNAYNCQSYLHVGQHGAADPVTVISQTRPATPKQYADLKKELTRRGYRLDILKRYRYASLEVRRKQL
jgi:hypothetical protein